MHHIAEHKSTHQKDPHGCRVLEPDGIGGTCLRHGRHIGSTHRREDQRCRHELHRPARPPDQWEQKHAGESRSPKREQRAAYGPAIDFLGPSFEQRSFSKKTARTPQDCGGQNTEPGLQFLPPDEIRFRC